MITLLLHKTSYFNSKDFHWHKKLVGLPDICTHQTVTEHNTDGNNFLLM